MPIAEAKKLIDRGVASDGSNPAGTAYLVSTNDKNRNVRAAGYASVRALMQSVMPIEIVEANALENKPDVIVLVSADASEVKPSTAGMQYYSYIIAADKAFRGYERLRTYTTSDPAYCVQVWARRASAHYAALNEALARQ